jgi:hypothetical protein
VLLRERNGGEGLNIAECRIRIAELRNPDYLQKSCLDQ